MDELDEIALKFYGLPFEALTAHERTIVRFASELPEED